MAGRGLSLNPNMPAAPVWLAEVLAECTSILVVLLVELLRTGRYTLPRAGGGWLTKLVNISRSELIEVYELPQVGVWTCV